MKRIRLYGSLMLGVVAFQGQGFAAERAFAQNSCNIVTYELMVQNFCSECENVTVSWSGGGSSQSNLGLGYNQCFRADTGGDGPVYNTYNKRWQTNTTYTVTVNVDGAISEATYNDCEVVGSPPSACTQMLPTGKTLANGNKNDFFIDISYFGDVEMGWEGDRSRFTDNLDANGKFNTLDPQFHPIGSSAFLGFYARLLRLNDPPPPQPETFVLSLENNLNEKVKVNGIWRSTPYTTTISEDDGTVTLIPKIWVYKYGTQWKFGYWTQWRDDLGYRSVPNPLYTTEYSNGTLKVYPNQIPASVDVLDFDGEYEVYKGGAKRGVEGADAETPAFFSVSNYPNPFNPETRITFALPEAGAVQVDVVNVLGQRVARFEEASYSRGVHAVVWGGDQPSGLYVYRVRYRNAETGETTQRTRQMVLMK